MDRYNFKWPRNSVFTVYNSVLPLFFKKEVKLVLVQMQNDGFPQFRLKTIIKMIKYHAFIAMAVPIFRVSVSTNVTVQALIALSA